MTADRTNVAPPAPARRRDLDLLRFLVVVGLVFFHSARPFDTGDFYIKNEPTSEAVDVIVAFLATWGMPLLFVVAGMGMFFSLRRRSAKQFGMERLRRLLIPLAFGLVVIVPPQVWTEQRTDPAYDQSYLAFLGDYSDVNVDPGGFPFVVGADTGDGLFEYGHLWFLVVLLTFSLLLLPLTWWLRGPNGARLLDWLANRADRLSTFVLAALPISALEMVLGSEIDLAAWNRYTYALFILYGYVLATDPRFGEALQRHRKQALAIGAATFLVTGALFATAADGAELLESNDLAGFASRGLGSLSGWMWIVAILGFGSATAVKLATEDDAVPDRSPTPLERLTAYASEAVLPIYILHQTVIVLIGFHILQWSMNAALKYLVLSLVSLTAIVAIYDVAVRRLTLTRFLFGMKPPTTAS